MILRVLALLIALSLIPGCAPSPTASVASAETVTKIYPEAININTASAEDLQRIPYIGEKLAAKIVAYREEHGPFRRAEHMMLIQGISDKRFRKIRPLVRVE